MRHLGTDSEIGNVDAGTENQVVGSDDGDSERTTDTIDIDCGVRSNAAFSSTAENLERLEYLQDVAGRQGICLREEHQ